MIASLVITLNKRELSPVYAKRLSNPPYIIVDETTIQNQFNLNIRNQHDEPIIVKFQLPETTSSNAIQLIKPLDQIEIQAGQKRLYSLFVRFPKTQLQDGRLALKISKIIDHSGQQTTEAQEIILIGPK